MTGTANGNRRPFRRKPPGWAPYCRVTRYDLVRLGLVVVEKPDVTSCAKFPGLRAWLKLACAPATVWLIRLCSAAAIICFTIWPPILPASRAGISPR